MVLSIAQQAALAHVHYLAAEKRAKSHANISQHLKALTSPTEEDFSVRVEEILKWIRENARITVNFHPDRLCKMRREGTTEEKWTTVAEALMEDNAYKCQFLTGISNGALTAYPGGDRDRWEERMFGKSYHRGTSTHHERPRYGGLNVFNYLDGACPRFGSCHFRLHQHMLDSSTFSYGDSVSEPEAMGVVDSFEPVLASLIESMATRGVALGNKMDVDSFLHLVKSNSECKPKTGRSLDDYIEAQVHADINLATDVEAVMVDPSFRGSTFEGILQKMADKNSFKLEWNEGFVMKVAEIPSEFRGPLMSPLASRIVLQFEAEDKTKEEFHAELLGRAARSVVLETCRWEDWANSSDSLQHIKYLWHTLVVYGRTYNP